MEYSVEQEFKRVWRVLRCKANCGSSVNFKDLPTYADNAEALAAGLVAGDLYKTGGNSSTFICIVV